MNENMPLGWVREIPDVRDYTPESVGMELKTPNSIPTVVDLRGWCPPIENQENIGSCTAHAGVGLMEMFQKRYFGKHTDLSRLFVYKTTRNLLGWTGDTGAYNQTTMKALVAFGAPPENYWPYDTKKYEVEPSAFLYALGDDFSAISYLKLDKGYSGNALLQRVKDFLLAAHPIMFGFTVYNSLTGSTFPFPEASDRMIGGHAVVAVGYDDNKVITHPVTKKQTKGAILIRNSWGTNWGENGYGWLPYQYVSGHLTSDWWILYSAKYIDASL